MCRTQAACGEFEDFLHLRVPVRPGVCAGELAVLVGDFACEEEFGEGAVGVDEKIFGAAVEVDEGERGDACGREVGEEFEEVVCGARGAVYGAVGARDGGLDEGEQGGVVLIPGGRAERAAQGGREDKAFRVFDGELQSAVAAHRKPCDGARVARGQRAKFALHVGDQFFEDVSLELVRRDSRAVRVPAVLSFGRDDDEAIRGGVRGEMGARGNPIGGAAPESVQQVQDRITDGARLRRVVERRQNDAVR